MLGYAWAMGRWILTAIVLSFASCTPPPEPTAMPPAEAPSEPAGEAFVAKVEPDGLHVQLVDTTAGVRVRLVLGTGETMRASTDEGGAVSFRPSLTQLFENEDTPIATVRTQGATDTVSLKPLIDAARSAGAGEWAKLEGERKAKQDKADAAITFAGDVYRDAGAKGYVDECKPSGPEQCFDGIDNDCDGRYDDQSCGYASGVLQWTLTWSGPAELDLHVIGPDGIEVWSNNPRNSNIRLFLDRACQDPTGARCQIWNAYVPSDQFPRSGTYMAWVDVHSVPDVDSEAASEPITCRLSGRIGTKTWYTDVSLAPMVGAEYRIAFPVGSDADKDGVEDSQDACPDAKGCWSPTASYRGCPDGDQDGVPNSIDACPNKPGLTSEDPNLTGCPKEFGDAWVTNLGVMITSRIEFDTGKATMRPKSLETLANVAEAILSRPGAVQRLAVDGHADDVGSDASNIKLSNRRAHAVVRELIVRGVSKGMLMPRGFGETKPLVDSQAADARQKNRRVEFLVLRPQPIRPECW